MDDVARGAVCVCNNAPLVEPPFWTDSAADIIGPEPKLAVQDLMPACDKSKKALFLFYLYSPVTSQRIQYAYSH